MASRDQSNKRKLELISQLTNHRKDITAKKQVLVQQIAESKEQLKDKINIPKLISSKIKSSFVNSPTKWFIGSTVAGLLISKIFFGSVGSIFKKPNKKKASRGIFYTLAAMAARPMIKSFLIGKAKDYVAHRLRSHQQEISQHDYEPESDYYYYR
jgi:hypothetical protein